MCQIHIGEPVAMIEKNATTSCLLEIAWVFFFFITSCMRVNRKGIFQKLSFRENFHSYRVFVVF